MRANILIDPSTLNHHITRTLNLIVLQGPNSMVQGETGGYTKHNSKWDLSSCGMRRTVHRKFKLQQAQIPIILARAHIAFKNLLNSPMKVFTLPIGLWVVRCIESYTTL